MRSICTFLLLLTAFYCTSCKKNGTNPPIQPPSGKSHATDILSYSIEGMDAQVAVMQGDKQVTVRFPDSLSSGANIAASFKLSPGATLTVNGVTQVSGSSKNDYEGEFSYLVTAEDGVTKTYWRVNGTNTTYSLNWGLGHIVKKLVSNNRDYEWYIDQANTGPYSSVNCGPSSVTMAMKWYDSTYTKTAEDARNFSPTLGNLWYPSTFTNYMSVNNIPFIHLRLNDDTKATSDLMLKELDKGRILITILYSNFIPFGGTGNRRVDRYYDWGNGHCIVIKGYAQVDGEYFFQVYDPWDYGAVYSDDGSLKGKDRYYRATDVAAGVQFQGNNVWAIPPK